jgi:hypothetical protein
MAGLLRAELIKLVKRRTYWVLLIVLAALTALLAFIFFVLPQIIGASDGEQGFPDLQKPDAYIFGAQQVLGQTWFPLILAVMFLAGELATSTWATALTRNARRWQHLVARLAVVTGGAWVAMLISIGAFGVATYLFAEGSGFPSGPEIVGVVWKSLLVMTTWVALGFAASAWLRSVGPAIGAVLAFSFGEGLLALWEGWRNVSLSIHTSALLGSLDIGGFGELLGGDISFGRGLTVVLVWAMVSLSAAWTGLQLKDA